jgi:uncharacterized protein YciU (UPF0263 family)
MANMKFKIGDRVRVKEGLTGGISYDHLYFDYGMETYCGKTAVITGTSPTGRYVLDIVGSMGYVFNDAMLEPCTFTKSDLKDGMVVESRNGDRMLFISGIFIDSEGSLTLRDYNDDFNYNFGIYLDKHSYDIVKIFSVNKTVGALDDLFEEHSLELIWERKEEPEYTEKEIEILEAIKTNPEKAEAFINLIK